MGHEKFRVLKGTALSAKPCTLVAAKMSPEYHVFGRWFKLIRGGGAEKIFCHRGLNNNNDGNGRAPDKIQRDAAEPIRPTLGPALCGDSHDRTNLVGEVGEKMK